MESTETTQQLSLPDWLAPGGHVIAKLPDLSLYEVVFEQLLEAVAKTGIPRTTFIKEHHSHLGITSFCKWIDKDPVRLERYEEARKYGDEQIEDQMIRISDGLTEEGDSNLEDIARSKLRVETRKFILSVRNPKRYGGQKDNVPQNSQGGINIILSGIEEIPTLEREQDGTPRLVIDNG